MGSSPNKGNSVRSVLHMLHARAACLKQDNPAIGLLYADKGASQTGGLLEALAGVCQALNAPVLSRKKLPPAHDIAPVVLVVAPNPRQQIRLRETFAQAGCRSFAVRNNMQALEWAPALPVSAIFLNTASPDAKPSIARMLYQAMQEGSIPAVPLELLAPNLTAAMKGKWRKNGIGRISRNVPKGAKLRKECTGYPIFDVDFYRVQKVQLLQEMSPAYHAHLPELRRVFSLQLEKARILLQRDIRGADVCMHHLRSVRSAALSLGYFRIAAVMAEIEAMLRTRPFLLDEHNKQIIIDCLLHAENLHENREAA